MTANADPCADCTACLGCQRRYCRAWETSSGEASGLCSDCWDVEDPEAVA